MKLDEPWVLGVLCLIPIALLYYARGWWGVFLFPMIGVILVIMELTKRFFGSIASWIAFAVIAYCIHLFWKKVGKRDRR